MSFKEFLYFQKSDRKVIVVALCAIVAALLAIFFLGKNSTTGTAGADGQGQSQQAEGEASALNAESSEGYAAPERFYFDPNTADSAQFVRLGLQPWQARNILKYRAKGGVYREPEDFARVYGLTVKQFRELLPYIRISPDYRPASEVYGRSRSYQAGRRYDGASPSGGRRSWGQSESVAGEGTAPGQTPTYVRDTVRYPIKLKAGEVLALDKADTTMLKKVPGIGSYYARKIVAYRDRLGGFAHVGQLLEIEGFPEEALPFLKVSPGSVRKLNLNTLSLNQLRSHPYINFYQAKAIVDRRRLKGPLHSLDELSLLDEFPPAELQRLAPYVEF